MSRYIALLLPVGEEANSGSRVKKLWDDGLDFPLKTPDDLGVLFVNKTTAPRGLVFNVRYGSDPVEVHTIKT